MNSKPMNSNQVVQLAALALLAHVALSWPLWFSGAGRSFPMLPLVDIPFLENYFWQSLQIGAVLLFIVLLLLFPQNKSIVIGSIVALLWMVIQDQSRLQPWLYFYLLLFGLHLADRNKPKAQLQYFRWLIVAVYAWGGFNKLTPYFAEDNFPWFCEAFSWTTALGEFPSLGYGVAVIEFLFAPGLLWVKTRPVFRWLVPGFHLFIIAALSPLGLNWNAIVIPWNLAMALMVWGLFAQKENKEQLFPFFRPNQRWYKSIPVLILGLAWIMPLLNIFHAWDESLSWKMYSNTQTEASFYSDSPPYPAIAAIWERNAYDQGRKLLLNDWSVENLHVPLYHSRRTHQQLARYLCDCWEEPANAGLIRLKVQRWNRLAEKWEQIPCNELNK